MMHKGLTGLQIVVFGIGVVSLCGSVFFFLSGVPATHAGFVTCCTVGMFSFVGLGIWTGMTVRRSK